MRQSLRANLENAALIDLYKGYKGCKLMGWFKLCNYVALRSKQLSQDILYFYSLRMFESYIMLYPSE